MQCRSCNTRAAATHRHCPNCGRLLRPGSPAEIRPQATRPGAGPSPSLPLAAGEVPQPMRGPRVETPQAATATHEPRPGFTLTQDELRAQVAERPELVEPGLRLVRDAQGRPAGLGYETAVGSIDFLCEDAEGRLVVLMLAGTGGHSVSEALARVGWVAEHLGGKDREVRAIVLLEPPPPELGYAARAVAGTVSFRTYRVALRFEEIRG